MIAETRTYTVKDGMLETYLQLFNKLIVPITRSTASRSSAPGWTRTRIRSRGSARLHRARIARTSSTSMRSRPSVTRCFQSRAIICSSTR